MRESFIHETVDEFNFLSEEKEMDIFQDITDS
jgi:hypothetical protein